MAVADMSVWCQVLQLTAAAKEAADDRPSFLFDSLYGYWPYRMRKKLQCLRAAHVGMARPALIIRIRRRYRAIDAIDTAK